MAGYPPNIASSNRIATAVSGVNGWASYNDGQYTSASPFTVSNGSTVTLPNNAAASQVDQLPDDALSFYNGTILQAINNGDAYVWGIRFTVEPSANNASIECGIDIGGDQGIIFNDSRRLTRGVGEANPISFTFSGFSRSVFLANGGTVKVTAEDGNLDIYDIVFFIERTHRAR